MREVLREVAVLEIPGLVQVRQGGDLAHLGREVDDVVAALLDERWQVGPHWLPRRRLLSPSPLPHADRDAPRRGLRKASAQRVAGRRERHPRRGPMDERLDARSLPGVPDELEAIRPVELAEPARETLHILLDSARSAGQEAWSDRDAHRNSLASWWLVRVSRHFEHEWRTWVVAIPCSDGTSTRFVSRSGASSLLALPMSTTSPPPSSGSSPQFGEDGIIQWLVRHVDVPDRTFVEFGVESYRESNTRLLVELDDWRGLAIDAGDAHKEFLERSEIAWRHTVVAKSAFLTVENLNEVIGGAGFQGDIGLVSIDVDGIDYWLLDALTVVSPRILVVEYNSLFGATAHVTVPYAADFHRTRAHFSTIYFGASISAMASLAAKKGYALVGSNRSGTNAFFVRRDVLGALPEVAPANAWQQTRVRQARDQDGELTYLSDWDEQLRLIADCSLVDVEHDVTTTVAKALAL